MKNPFSVRHLLLLLALMAGSAPAPSHEVDTQHVTVYREKGRFGGWPANHGIWSWGNEILVGFSVGYYKDLGPERHNIDREKPEEHVLARSIDGGMTWTIELPSKQNTLIGTPGMRHGTLSPDATEADLVDCPGGIDFTHADFAMTCRMAGVDTGVSRFYYSTNRGHAWKGPFRLPSFEQKGIAARTDYIVNGKEDCAIFLTASKNNNREGRPICGRTTDGGKSWKFISFIGPEPKGYSIMPSTVRISPRNFVSAIRRGGEEGERRAWIEAWSSSDDGHSWTQLIDPVPNSGEGNPAHLLKLADGRLCLTYGQRAKPFGIFARISSNSGKSWSEPITLRDDGGGRDLGYPRSVQRPDGTIVTVYYFWDLKTGPERYIAATLWTPGH